MRKLIELLFGKKEYFYVNEYYRIEDPDTRIFSALHESEEYAKLFAYNFYSSIYVKTHKIRKP